MIKKEKFLSLVFLNALVALVVDALAGAQENYMNVIHVVVFDLPILYVLYLAIKGKQWAYITGLIYTLFRSFNYYFDSFTLYTKNGLNIEITVNNIGINVISFLLLVFWLFDFYKRNENSRLRISLTSIFVFVAVSITYGSVSTKDTENSATSYFKNTLTVTPEHCKSWGLPTTSFAIEYPSSLEPELNADNSYYVRFRDIRDKQIIQEITIGTIGEIRSNDQALLALNKTDSTFRSMNGISYEKKQLGIASIEDFNLPTLKAKLNFDGLNMPLLDGWYSATLFFILPITPDLSGVNISFTHEIVSEDDLNLNELEKKILKSFRLK